MNDDERTEAAQMNESDHVEANDSTDSDNAYLVTRPAGERVSSDDLVSSPDEHPKQLQTDSKLGYDSVRSNDAFESSSEVEVNDKSSHIKKKKKTELPQQLQLVRCPKCGNFLREPAGYSVYLCGGCSTVLRAKKQMNDYKRTEAAQMNESDHVEANSLAGESVSSNVLISSPNENPKQLRTDSKLDRSCQLDKETKSEGMQSIYQLEQEIALLSQFEHENIVRYFGTGKDESKLYIFLELVTKGSLLNLYQRYDLTDSQVSAYTRQILHGLKYLHDRNVVHRDIKCANILVDASGYVKIADFGLAKATKLNDVKSCKGTPFWMAPEVVNNKNQGYGTPADIWSLGCTVLEVLTRQIPYLHLEYMQALFQIGRGVPPPVSDLLSKDAREFILQCLQTNPSDRPTAAQLLDHSSVLSFTSPYEKLFARKPNYNFFKTFGCTCFPYLRDYSKHKLDFHTSKCVFIGYSINHKGYKCLHSNGKVFISRNVVFNELEFPFKSLFGAKPAEEPVTNSQVTVFLPSFTSPASYNGSAGRIQAAAPAISTRSQAPTAAAVDQIPLHRSVLCQQPSSEFHMPVIQPTTYEIRQCSNNVCLEPYEIVNLDRSYAAPNFDDGDNCVIVVNHPQEHQTFEEPIHEEPTREMALPERVTEIVEPSLLLEARTGNNSDETFARRRCGDGRDRIEECLVGILRIGVVCSMESPAERMTMTDVVAKLSFVKENFLGRRI
ncbi:hypothetical protein EZV62_025857 [Acer yangbiense]|uniref:Protein kinase domain-containing protein n=1 Tax=Acer yangbiense TaxID=1000413 RepID=A0A5C7H0J4_9ROSI|nr:hypothetical protein EZV62_025857 [Acer yangbiense]